MAPPSPPCAPFFHVTYGFEATPARMFNANVANAVLLSFVRAACLKDLDDACRHKTVQLGVELDASRRLLAARGVDVAARRGKQPGSRPASGASTSASRPASRPASSRPSRPASGASTSRSRAESEAGEPALPPEQDADGQLAAAVARHGVLERQLEVVAAATRVVKELGARTAWVDLAGDDMARLGLDAAPEQRASAFVTLHGRHSAVAVSRDDAGELRVTPLTFALPKLETDSE